MTEEPQPAPSASAAPPHQSMLSRRQTVVWALLAMGVGIVGGLFLPQDGIRRPLSQWLTPPTVVEEEEPTASEDGAFELSHAAQKTFGLTISKVQPSTFTQNIRLPAFVREQPAVSNLQASSRLHGVVRKIFVQVGQSVREGDPLVELELTGDELASSQATLLDSVQQLRVIEDEIERLRPAAEAGGIAKKSLIDKQYEQRRVRARVESTRQELLIRGLSVADIEHIVKDGELVRFMQLNVPTGIRPQDSSPNDQVTTVQQASHKVPVEDDWVYSLESLNISPGSVVAAGEPLCDLAYHESLLVEGQAYERDLSLLTRLMKERNNVSISVGDRKEPIIIDDLQILFMDNHVDNETQTYRFYVEIPNRVLAETVTEHGRRFRTWQFKPGQRGHVLLPKQTWSEKIVLPAAAVAEDGLDHVVFRRTADHDHFHGDVPPHSEFRKIVVSVDYKDQYNVVIDHNQQWKPWFEIATNNGDMLMRASSENSGGGHAHHGHEH